MSSCRASAQQMLAWTLESKIKNSPSVLVLQPSTFCFGLFFLFCIISPYCFIAEVSVCTGAELPALTMLSFYIKEYDFFKHPRDAYRLERKLPFVTLQLSQWTSLNIHHGAVEHTQQRAQGAAPVLAGQEINSIVKSSNILNLFNYKRWVLRLVLSF